MLYNPQISWGHLLAIEGFKANNIKLRVHGKQVKVTFTCENSCKLIKYLVHIEIPSTLIKATRDSSTQKLSVNVK